MVQNGVARRWEVANNVIIMYVRLAVITAANFVAVRIVMQALGAEGFGTYAAVVAAVGLPAFFSSALQGAARRFLCVERGKPDGDRRLRFSEILALTFALSALVLGGVFVLGLMTVPVRYPLALFAVLGGLSVFNFALMPLEALISAEERFGFLLVFSVVQAVLSLAVAGVVSLKPTLVVYGLANLAVVGVKGMVYAAYCRRSFSFFTLRPRFSQAALTQLLPFFSWSALGTVAGFLKASGIVIVISALSGATANAAFDAACRVGGVIWLLTDVYRTVYYPRIGKAWGAGDVTGFSRETLHAFRHSLYAFGPIATVIFVFAPQVAELWLGTPPPGTAAFIRCVAVQYFFEALSTPFDSAVLVRGKIARYQIVLTVLLGSSCPLAWILLALGAPVWTASGAVALVTFISFWYRLSLMRPCGTRASLRHSGT